jgi:exodeoxyribonuclease-3
VTWNVNGLRACAKKGLVEYLADIEADIIAIQETKVNLPIDNLELPGYGADWCFAERIGYSGTLCFFKDKPLSITHGLGEPKLDTEGRLITLEYPSFYFINSYVPNSQGGLDRWYYRLEWDVSFAGYLEKLQGSKPVIVCGDFNVARDYIDIYPENLRNEENPHGFMTEERDGFNAILDVGCVDVFRELYPDRAGAYSWWSNRLNKRLENRGWRIDYFLVTEQLLPFVHDCKIRADILGSDHAPLEMIIDLCKS